jgi:hypothetical protein
MSEFFLQYEVPLRLGLFFGVFAFMALWEILRPRRALSADRLESDSLDQQHRHRFPERRDTASRVSGGGSGHGAVRFAGGLEALSITSMRQSG